jgi:Fe-S-cluster containining protein
VQSSDSGSGLPLRTPSGRLRLRARQAAGKIRRFFRASIYTRKNEELLALRQGECTRCGACCKILFRCPFLVEQPENPPGEVYSCSIYGSRFSQCRIYPLVPKDLLEVDEPCGYTFTTSNPPAE